MRFKTHLLSVLFVTLTLSAGIALAQPAPLTGFDEYVEKARQAWEVPGLAIAVVKDDKIVFAKGYGVRKVGDADAGR